MTSQARVQFYRHLDECREAIALYEHIEKTTIYRPDFNLRFVWIAAVSAFDHYVSQLILECATKAFANNETMTPKLMSEVVPFSNVLELKQANAVDSILVFRKILSMCIKFKSFQHPDKVSDGLSYIWHENHKWQFIAKKMGIQTEIAKGTLENIVDRRNVIAHNADFDEAIGQKLPVSRQAAVAVVEYFSKIIDVIDAELAS